MAARPIGSATLSFGLVSVPVEMYPTYESKATISFNMINPKTGSRVKQEYVDGKTGDKVERSELVKGYEFEKGKYVTFTKDEMASLDAKKTETIEIHEFVPADQVERIYFDRAYYLGSGKGGDRAYLLLAEAMRKTGLAAIGQYNARGKSYLVMLRPAEQGLVLEQLHYGDEVRDFGDVPVPKGDVKPAELNLAVQLIEQAKSAEFNPDRYKDEVQERIKDQVQRKVDGQEITAEPAEKPQTQVLDLMEALKASLAKGGLKAGGERKPAKRAESKPAAKSSKVKALKKKSA